MALPVAARIVVAQATVTPPVGYVSGSVDDLVLDQLITLTNTSDAGVNGWQWEVFPAVGVSKGSMGVTGEAAATLTLTPPGPYGFGDVAVKLTVYGDPLPGGQQNVATDEVILGIRAPNAIYAAGIPIPHPHETSAGKRLALNPATGREGRVAEACRALALGAGGGPAVAPAEWAFTLSGVYDGATLTAFIDPPRRALTSRTISRVEIYRRTAGASGTTRCDVKKNGTSIFSGTGTQPQVTAAAGDYAYQTLTTFVSGAAAMTAGSRLEVTLEAVETYLAGPPEGPEGILVVVYF